MGTKGKTRVSEDDGEKGQEEIGGSGEPVERQKSLYEMPSDPRWNVHDASGLPFTPQFTGGEDVPPSNEFMQSLIARHTGLLDSQTQAMSQESVVGTSMNIENASTNTKGDYPVTSPRHRFKPLATKRQEQLKKTGAPKKNKGTPNKRWNKEEASFLIKFLIEQVAMGMKVHKNFKKPVFAAAAAVVNKRFGTDFVAQNVENYVKGLKYKWREICICRDLSGARWDGDRKMILLDSPTYDTYMQAYPKRSAYINKPIKDYDALRIVCVEDHMTGPSVAREFMLSARIVEPTDPYPHEPPLSKRASEHPTVGETTPSAPATTPGPSSLKKPARSRSASKRGMDESMIEMTHKICEGLTNVAKALQYGASDVAKSIIDSSPHLGWRNRLSAVIESMDEYDENDREAVFDELVKDEQASLAFLTKKPHRQVKFVGDRIEALKGGS